MVDDIRLKTLIDEIMNINAPILNVFGTGMPGNAGISESQEGAINSGMDVTWQLKQKAIAFGEACRHNLPKQDIIKLANDVEGELLGEQLVNVLNEKQVNRLIDELHEIIKTV